MGKLRDAEWLLIKREAVVPGDDVSVLMRNCWSREIIWCHTSLRVALQRGHGGWNMQKPNVPAISRYVSRWHGHYAVCRTIRTF